MKNSADRFEWVDFAKGLGILLVVYGHVARGLVSAGLISNSPLFQCIDSIIYTFHMPLFFFLSGLFLLPSIETKGFSKVVGSKFDTILYPYIIWSVFQGAIEVLLSNYTNGNVSVGDVISLFMFPRAQFWFLYALFFIFIFTLLSLYLLGRRALPFLLLIAVFIYIFGPNTKSAMAINNFSENLIFFLFGAVYYDNKLMRFNNGVMTSLFLIMLITVQYVFHSSGLTYNDKGFFLLCVSIISLLAVVSISQWCSRFNIGFINYLGVSSMAIYLMHILAGSGVRVLLEKVFSVESAATHLIVGTVLGVVLPLIGLKIIQYMRFPYAFTFPLSRFWSKT